VAKTRGARKWGFPVVPTRPVPSQQRQAIGSHWPRTLVQESSARLAEGGVLKVGEGVVEEEVYPLGHLTKIGG